MSKRDAITFAKSYVLRVESRADCIRAEGWIVRRLAPGVWKVSDHRRCTVAIGLRPATRRRHYIFNDAQLLKFAGYDQ